MMSLPHQEQKRPALKRSRKSGEIALEIIAAAALLYMIADLVYWWASVPETVPRHFDITGKADAWGSKNSLLFLPAISLLLYIFMSVINHFPQMFNYPVTITEENAEMQYQIARTCLIVLKTEITLVLAYIQWAIIRNKTDLGHGFVLLILITILGNVSYSIYRSYKYR